MKHAKILLFIIIATLLIKSDTYNITKHIFQYPQKEANLNIPEQPFGIERYGNTDAKTIIVSHYTLNNNTFIEQVIQNHRKYAKKHGYDYWFRNGIIDEKLYGTGITLYWQKPIIIQQAINVQDKYNKKYKYEWILWIDGDATFTNLNKSLEQLKKDMEINNNHFFVIARDMGCIENNICPEHCCFNAGVLLIRNNQQARNFIQATIDDFSKYYNNPVGDQAAFEYEILKPSLDLYKNYKNKCDLPTTPGVMVVDSIILNSGYARNWRAGHFIAHFTGTNNASRNITIPKFLQCLQNNKYPYLQECEHSKLN